MIKKIIYRQKVLEHIKNLYLNKIKPELSSMSLNMDNIP